MASAKNNTAIQTAQAAIQAAPEKPTMQQLIKRMSGEIEKALPSVITPERFTRMVMSALSANPKLSDCTPKSFLGAMMTAAQLGVEPNTPLGQAYLIPYKHNWKDDDGNWHNDLDCQFQLGYKGMLDLAYRSGEVSVIQAHEVYENDEFEYAFGLEPTLVHKPAATERGKVIAYYAMFKTKDGGFGFEVMSVDDIIRHAKSNSKSYSNGPWQTNFDEMAKKTVLKKVLKYAPLKSDFVKAVTADETVKSKLSADMYEVPDEVVYTVDENTGIVVDDATGEAVTPNK